MLKTVEDSGAQNSKTKVSQDRLEENPIINEENDTKKNKKTFKVRFAKNNEQISEPRNLPIANSKDIGGRNKSSTLPSILKSTKFKSPGETEKDIKEIDKLLEKRDSSRSFENLTMRRSPVPKSKRGRKSNAERQLALVTSNRGKTLRSEESHTSNEELKTESRVEDKTKDDSSPLTPDINKVVRNTRSRLRRSRDSTPTAESNTPGKNSNDNELTEGESPLENGLDSVAGGIEKNERGKSAGRGRGRSGRRGKNLRKGFSNVGSRDEGNISETEIELVKCARCEEQVPKNSWQSHNLHRHNNMGWQESELPLDFDNDPKLLNRVLVAAHKKKRGVLNCEKCGTVKRSVVGFVSHIQFCGKSSEERNALLVTCPVCNRTMMPSSLEVHHRVHKQSSTESPDSIGAESSTSTVVAIGSKRKAAERAITKISEFTALVREDERPPSKKSRSSSLDIKKMIQKPQLKKTIPGILRTLWKKEILKKGVACCRQPGCAENFPSIEQIYKHYSTCNFTPRKTFTCKVCKFDSEREEDIVNHVAENHTSERSSNNGSNSEERTDDEDEDDDDEEEAEEDDDDDDMSDGDKTKKKNEPSNHVSHHWKKKPKSWYKIEFLAKEGSQNLSKPYLPSVKWTLEFELENYQLNLFNDLLPNVFQLLDNDEVDGYLPELEVSMATKKMHMKRYNDKIESSRIEWKRWNKFEGNVEEGMLTFFVGGPVWAMSWLPIPVPMFSANVDQFLAISTHPKMESEWSLGRNYVGKNIIQIWNVGKLNNKDGRVDGTPTLAYAIAHTSGTIWCMEWCPSGCYQDKSLSNNLPTTKNGERAKMRRMGLLAAASSDGCVHIYSAPFPEELENRQPDDEKQRIFKTEPVVTLVVNTTIYENDKQNWQCTKLNWTKENGHDTIVAGFSNGYIALWNLITNSPLLLKTRGNTTFINAGQHFFAHGHSVSAVSLVPYGGKRYLATAGLDRCYKFWDLENTSGPQTLLKRGVVVDGAWFTHWPASVNSYDDVLGLNHTCTNLIALREYGYKICLGLATNSPVYTVSISDYGNAIAHGSLAGEVQTAFAHQLLIGMDVDRSVAKKRRLNSLVKIIDLNEANKSDEDKSTNAVNKVKKNQKHSTDYKYTPDTYEGYKNRFGIIFYDMPWGPRETVTMELEKKVLQTDQLSMVPLESYPIASVNKVSWNPNAWSYLWLATGYQCGIIRISCSKSMHIPATINQILPKHVNRLIVQ